MFFHTPWRGTPPKEHGGYQGGPAVYRYGTRDYTCQFHRDTDACSREVGWPRATKYLEAWKVTNFDGPARLKASIHLTLSKPIWRRICSLRARLKPRGDHLAVGY